MQPTPSGEAYPAQVSNPSPAPREGATLSTEEAYPPPEETEAPRINPTTVPGVTVILEGDVVISDLTPFPTLGPPKIVAHEYFASATALPIIPVADNAEGELKYLSMQNKGMSSTNTVLSTKDGDFSLAKSGIDLPVPEFGDVSRSPNGEWIAFSDNNSNVTFFKPDEAGTKGTTINFEMSGAFSRLASQSNPFPCTL